MLVTTAFAQDLSDGGTLTNYTPWVLALIGTGVGIYLSRRKK